VLINDVTMTADPVMPRFKTYSVAAWVQNVRISDREEFVAMHNGLKLSKDRLSSASLRASLSCNGASG
jgi:hypothetical protein